MSAWKMLVRMVYDHGPPGAATVHRSAIREAKGLGLLAHDEQRRWALTPLGVEWCQGRVEQVESRPGGRRFVATWLRALPTNLTASDWQPRR